MPICHKKNPDLYDQGEFLRECIFLQVTIRQGWGICLYLLRLEELLGATDLP